MKYDRMKRNSYFPGNFLRQQLSTLVEMRALDLLTYLRIWRANYSSAWCRIMALLPRLLTSVLSIVYLPYSITYFFWIRIPLCLCSLIWRYLNLFLQVVSRRSRHGKRLLLHVSALSSIVSSFKEQIMCTKISELVENSAQIFSDFVQSMWYSTPSSITTKHSSSISELELLSYVERDDEFPSENQARQKMHRNMHNFIPTNPFTATVRISRPSIGSMTEELSLCVEKESPISFPNTPFSRARIMNRSVLFYLDLYCFRVYLIYVCHILG